jgi:hypothetical protein
MDFYLSPETRDLMACGVAVLLMAIMLFVWFFHAAHEPRYRWAVKACLVVGPALLALGVSL